MPSDSRKDCLENGFIYIVLRNLLDIAYINGYNSACDRISTL